MQKSIENLVTREENAVESFTNEIQEQFGFSQNSARKAFDTLDKLKLVKIDYNIGRFQLKDGRIWDKEVLERAANYVE